jgi:tetratricopeptide (TPR) repeat protein
MKICLNMIVKNEAKIIARALDSALPLIDSWCIIDTGSIDNTIELIREKLSHLPGEIISRPWVNFGYNRSEALEFAKGWGDWALLIDADMVLVNHNFDKNLLASSIGAYQLIQKTASLNYYNIRLINLKFNWECIGVTHEYYKIRDGNAPIIKLDSLYISDIGDGGSKSDKFERDIKLLKQGLIDDPNNIRYSFYLAQSYRDIKNWDSAIYYYNRCANEDPWEEEAWYSEYMVALCMMHRGDSSEIFSQKLLKSWIRRPWRSEPIFELAYYYSKMKDWDKSYYLLKLVNSIDYPNNDILFISSQIYDWKAQDEFGVAAYWKGHYQESYDIFLKLLENPKLPPTQIPRINKNLEFSREKIKHNL